MSTQFEMTAEKRNTTGKGANRRMRAKGLIPAVLYGRGSDPVSLSVDPKMLKTAMSGPARLNTLLQIEIREGDSSLGKRTALLKDYQYHALRGGFLHADFVSIDLTESIKVRVPIEVTGRAAGLVDGGIIQQIRRDIGISCLPTEIPASVEVDVTALNIGDSIHVADVTLPAGVTATDSGSYTLLTCAAPEVEKVEATEVEGEGVEGEGVEGEATDEKADDKEKEKDKDKA